MKKISLGILIIITALAISGITTAATVNPTPDHQGKPDLQKPVQATDVELVKKITVRGSRGKGKPSGPAATGTLGTTVSVSGNKYAIVIGIADYPGTGNDLKYTDEDAEEMITSLTTYGFKTGNIQSFIDKEGGGAKNAIRNDILNTIGDVCAISNSEDEIVFFFSGHGMKGRADDGDKEAMDESIVVHDGSKIVPIWDGELKTAFANCGTSRIVLIFDSCLAGGMTDLKAEGRIINMATTETGTAYEFDSLENGQFTYYFVDEGMIGGQADTTPADGMVTIEESFDYAKNSCQLQTPTINDSFVNDLLL